MVVNYNVGGRKLMRKIVVLGMMICLMVFVVACVNETGNEMGSEEFEFTDEFSRGDIPQTGEWGDVLTVEERMERIRDIIHPEGGGNVIVGVPIEFIEGDLQVENFYHNSDESEGLRTDYYFRVIDWVWGEPDEDIIRVSSSVGNIFKLGGEYTFLAGYTNRVLHGQAFYGVSSQIWTLDNSEVSELELQEFHEKIRNSPPSQREREQIIEEAVPTIEFFEQIDLAIVATVNEVWDHGVIEGAFETIIDIKEVVYGEVDIENFSEIVRFRGDVTVGNDYLFLFRRHREGWFYIAARQGSVIPYGSDEFHQFMELFDSVE